jgi:tRNA (guanosine-2'-O-)-methyltransferase
MPIPEQLSNAEKKKLLEYLYSFISENKQQKFAEKIIHRTRHMTIVLEDIFQPHNASAVLRTCDCFGIQDIHIIENENKYEVNPDVALGSSKWLTMYSYNKAGENTTACLETLKKQGYRIIATTPHKDDHTPETLPIDTPFALVFGTELKGLTGTALEMADDYVKIPMYGFTESLNISVSAALFIRAFAERLKNSDIPWMIPEDQKTGILIAWTMNVIRSSDQIMKDYLKKLTSV